MVDDVIVRDSKVEKAVSVAPQREGALDAISPACSQEVCIRSRPPVYIDLAPDCRLLWSLDNDPNIDL